MSSTLLKVPLLNTTSTLNSSQNILSKWHLPDSSPPRTPLFHDIFLSKLFKCYLMNYWNLEFVINLQQQKKKQQKTTHKWFMCHCHRIKWIIYLFLFAERCKTHKAVWMPPNSYEFVQILFFFSLFLSKSNANKCKLLACKLFTESLKKNIALCWLLAISSLQHAYDIIFIYPYIRSIYIHSHTCIITIKHFR